MRGPGPDLDALLGSARGPWTRLRPLERLLAGGLVLGAALLAPSGRPEGALLLVCLVTLFWAACRPPLGALSRALVLGLAMFLPLFLFAPFVDVPPEAGPLARLLPPWRLFATGLGALLITTALFSSLPAHELHEALARLRPRALGAILAQVLHQSGALATETRRMTAALAVRSAGGPRGPHRTWRLLRALPLVWLPRVARRAERVAAAMELRGLGAPLPRFDLARARARDALGVLGAAGLLGLAVLLRLEVGG
jgi:energy-coupling factor transporter transmembrane protein EcfT